MFVKLHPISKATRLAFSPPLQPFSAEAGHLKGEPGIDTLLQGKKGEHTYPVACTRREETAENTGVVVILEDRKQHVTARVEQFIPGGAMCF